MSMSLMYHSIPPLMSLDFQGWEQAGASNSYFRFPALTSPSPRRSPSSLAHTHLLFHLFHASHIIIMASLARISRISTSLYYLTPN